MTAAIERFSNTAENLSIDDVGFPFLQSMLDKAPLDPQEADMTDDNERWYIEQYYYVKGLVNHFKAKADKGDFIKKHGLEFKTVGGRSGDGPLAAASGRCTDTLRAKLGLKQCITYLHPDTHSKISAMPGAKVAILQGLILYALETLEKNGETLDIKVLESKEVADKRKKTMKSLKDSLKDF